ncbi:hypothetical protein HRbin30_00065 [bacterium HR30]|nr:hypothetical protein HRbin30_00065 [bacterium HR30]
MGGRPRQAAPGALQLVVNPLRANDREGVARVGRVWVKGWWLSLSGVPSWPVGSVADVMIEERASPTGAGRGSGPCGER